MSDSLRDRIMAFLAAHTTMTLATVRTDALTGTSGAPQAAAVFYAPDDELNLYFLSEPTTRHARNLATDPRVAATIQADGQDWRQIRGLQIEGMAFLVEDVGEMAHAAQVYAARFDFLAGLLTGAGEGAPALVGPLVRSRFYVLRPHWLRLIDNRVHFGYKEELWLGQWEGEPALPALDVACPEPMVRPGSHVGTPQALAVGGCQEEQSCPQRLICRLGGVILARSSR